MNKPILLLLVFSSVNLFAGGPFEPVRTMIIPSAWHTMTIDGYATESSYGEEQGTYIVNPTGYNDSGKDFDASFRVCWDYEYFYLYANIVDDTNQSYQGEGNPWEYDNITVFMQLDTNTMTLAWTPTTSAFRINRGVDSILYAGHASASDFIMSLRSDGISGWYVEVGVPWTFVLPIGAEPDDIFDYLTMETVIGFEVLITDNDTEQPAGLVQYYSQSEWDADDFYDPHDEITIWFDNRFFGYAQLKTNGLPVPDREDPPIRLKLYPNPTTQTLQIHNLADPGQIQIYDQRGVLIFSKDYFPGQELDISGLYSGLYTLFLDHMPVGRFIKQ